MDYLPNLLRECCPDSKIAKGVQCGRTKATQIAEKISKLSKNNILKTLQSTKFSLIVDETTDISTKKCLALAARYANKCSKVILDRFLGLIELTKTDADSIYNEIKNFFEINNIPLSNVIGLATDGANVMAGEMNGLQAKFKMFQNIFFIKCSCHSLHLCAAYSCQKLPKYIETLCRNIYKYFSYSAKRLKEFEEFQKYFALPAHKILGLSLTRWLALEACINRVLEQWDALKLYFISSFGEVSGIHSKTLAEQMDKVETKVYFYFLSYILKIINDLNKEFQSEHIRLPYLYNNVEMMLKLILNNFLKKQNWENGSEVFDLNLNDDKNYKNIEDIYIGINAEKYMKNQKFTDEEKKEVKTKILNFYIELSNQLKIRFDFSDKPGLKCLNVITPQSVLDNSEPSLMPLIEEFSHLIEGNIEIIATQWRALQYFDHQIRSDANINEFWEKVSSLKNGLGERCFKELGDFVLNLLSLPHSSVAAERFFSLLNLIKTKLRNKLELSTINNIMLSRELLPREKDNHYVWSAKDFF